MVRILLLTLYVLLATMAVAQDESHSTLYGVGTSNVLDTYLSPYNYKGLNGRFVRETLRPTLEHRSHKVYYQTFFEADVSYLKNKSQSAHEYVVGIRYSNAWMYRFNPFRGLSVYSGLQPSLYLGGIYNTKGGNNPAQAKTDLMLSATAKLKYDLKLSQKVFPISYQLIVPLMGVAYSPNYGQSYYEEFSLGNYDYNVVFAYLGNMPTMRHLLTVDIPIGSSSLRVGWYGAFNQAKFNGLRYHSYSNNFVIGYTRYFNR